MVIYCYHFTAPSCICLSSLSYSTITLVGAKKRKRNVSSDHSDGELSPASPAALEEDLITVRHIYIHLDLLINCTYNLTFAVA